MRVRDLVWMGWMGLSGCLGAHAHPAPGHVALSADFLYLLPSVDYTYYVIDSTATDVNDILPNGTILNNDFGFSPGFRVGGVYGLCTCDREIEVYYSRLSVEQSSSTSGPFLTVANPTFGFTGSFASAQAGTADVSLNLLYQRADAWVTNPFVFCYCDLRVDVLAGAEFAYIRLNENLNLATTDGSTPTLVQQQAKTWGVGPQLGAEFDYRLCSFSCGRCPGELTVCGLSSWSFLTSKLIRNVSKDIFEEFGGTSTGPYTFEDTWKVIPAFHAKLGLNYAADFFCWGASLEVGYEYHLYLNSLNRYSYNLFGTVEPLTTDFDAQGLYVSIAATF